MNNIICCIPAREGSKRVKNKNIRLLNKKPLFTYSIDIAKKSKYISRVIVTTDSEKIANISVKNKVEVIIRPEELASDKSNDYEYLQHMLQYYKDNELSLPKYIVLLRPTTPIRDVSIINKAIRLFLKHEDATSLRSISELSESPYKAFVIGKCSYLKGLLEDDINRTNLPNQMLPIAYNGNGYIDILKTDVILNTKTVYGDKILPFIINDVHEIDTEEDLKYLEWKITCRI